MPTGMTTTAEDLVMEEGTHEKYKTKQIKDVVMRSDPLTPPMHASGETERGLQINEAQPTSMEGAKQQGNRL